MEWPSQTSVLRINDAERAAAFESPLRLRLLLACSRQDRSLSQLQRELGAPLSKLHYHANRLIALNLLVTSRLEPRPGRPIRYYKAVAEAFLVSRAAISDTVGDQLSTELRQSLGNVAASRKLSLLYRLDEKGRLIVRMTEPDAKPGPPRAREYWKVVSLTGAQRLALSGEIEDLIRRYESGPARGGDEVYLLHIAYAPKPRSLRARKAR